MLLIDWTEAIQPKPEVKFDPGYAIHLMGLGFSPKIPDLFQDSIRKGLNFSTLLTPASRSPKVETLGHCIALSKDHRFIHPYELYSPVLQLRHIFPSNPKKPLPAILKCLVRLRMVTIMLGMLTVFLI